MRPPPPLAARLLRSLQLRSRGLLQVPLPGFAAPPRDHLHSGRPLVGPVLRLEIQLPRLRLIAPQPQLLALQLQLPTFRLQLLPPTLRVVFGSLDR